MKRQAVSCPQRSCPPSLVASVFAGSADARVRSLMPASFTTLSMVAAIALFGFSYLAVLQMFFYKRAQLIYALATDYRKTASTLLRILPHQVAHARTFYPNVSTDLPTVVRSSRASRAPAASTSENSAPVSVLPTTMVQAKCSVLAS